MHRVPSTVRDGTADAPCRAAAGTEEVVVSCGSNGVVSSLPTSPCQPTYILTMAAADTRNRSTDGVSKRETEKEKEGKKKITKYLSATEFALGRWLKLRLARSVVALLDTTTSLVFSVHTGISCTS